MPHSIKTVFSLIVFLLAFNAYAEMPPQPNALIISSPSATQLMYYPTYLSYERALSAKYRVYAGTGFSSFETGNYDQEELNIIAGVKRVKDLGSFHTLFELRTGYSHFWSGPGTNTQATYSIEPLVGVRYYFATRFSVEAKTGLRFAYSEFRFPDPGNDYTAKGITVPTIDVGVGMHW